MSPKTQACPPAPPSSLLKEVELGPLLGLKPDTIRRLARKRNGSLPEPVMVGSRRYYSRESIDRWLRGQDRVTIADPNPAGPPARLDAQTCSGFGT